MVAECRGQNAPDMNSTEEYAVAPNTGLNVMSKCKRPKPNELEYCPLARIEKQDQSQPPFILLGIDIGHVSPAIQFTCAATGVFSCLMIYGYLQEKIVVQQFQRTLGTFVTLLQFGGYTLLGFIFLLIQRNFARKIPLKQYVILASLQTGVQVFTNLSMRYLNYPAKVIFKSSRVVATIVIGSLVNKKRYPVKDWVVVLLLLAGLTLFMQAEILTSPIFDVKGVVLILIALVCDALVLNAQEDFLGQYDAHQDELIFYSFLGSSLIMMLITYCNGEFFDGITFVHEKGWKILFEILIFTAAGYLGLSCTTAITKHFGALVSAITTTSRKALTLILSFLLFPKPFVFQHFFGALFFVCGLFLKSWKTSSVSNKPETVSENAHDIEANSAAVAQH